MAETPYPPFARRAEEEEEDNAVNYIPEVPLSPEVPRLAQGDVVGLPGMGPDVDPAALENMLKGDSVRRQNYGMKATEDLENSISAQESSPRARVSDALAGLGDAVSRGVAGVDTDFAGEVSRGRDASAQKARDRLGRLRDMNIQEINAEMDSSAKIPTSPLSRAAQSSYGPLLKAAGMSDADIAKMPASLISDIASKRISLADALAKSEMAAASLGLQKAGLEENKRKAAAEEEDKDRQRKVNAAKILAETGPFRRTAEAIFPGFRSDETKILRQEAGLDSPPPSGHHVGRGL